MLSPARHSHEPDPDAPMPPSSSSTRSRCDLKSFETRPRHRRPVPPRGMPLRAHTRDRDRTCWRRIQSAPARSKMQLAKISRQNPHHFSAAPIALESAAATAIGSGYPAETVLPSRAPENPLGLRRLPGQMQGQLRSPPPDPMVRASTLLLRSAGLPRDCRKPPRAEPLAPAIPPHFLYCPLERQSPPPAWSVPVPCSNDRHRPRCQMPVRVPNSRNRPCRRTTSSVLPCE